MTKLDEIEARGDTVIGLRPEDEELLIRAVRQLGREVTSWYSSRPDLATERIDADILELIAELHREEVTNG